MPELRFDRLDEWLDWQETLHSTDIEMRLERIREVAHRLDILKPDLPIITVAGTNGKGSCVAMLDAILQAAGYRTGAYTSPYLYRYNERFSICGESCADKEIVGVFQQIDKARGDVTLTYFEFSTLAAVLLFSQRPVDVAILEVGLGGRLDAVNTWSADVAVITSIGIDHVQWLGDTREKIGAEKAGIMRAGAPVICGDPEPPSSIGQQAEATKARLYQAGEDFSWEVSASDWRWRAKGVEFKELPHPNVQGRFQFNNAATVIAALTCRDDLFAIDEHHIQTGLTNIRLQGRLQLLSDKPRIIQDVAHNGHASGMLRDWLQADRVEGKTWAVFSMLADKDIEVVLATMNPVIDHWLVFPLIGPRGRSIEELDEMIKKADLSGAVSLYPDMVSLWKDGLNRLSVQDRVVVFGSFHVLADFRRVFDVNVLKDKFS